MIYFISLIALLLPTYLIRFDIGGVPSTLLEVLIWIVFVAGIIRVLQDRSIWERLQSRKVWLLPVGLIALGGLLGVLAAPDLRVALGLYKGFILDPILVYVLALAFLQTRKDVRVLGWGLFGGATIVALWSLLDAGTSASGGSGLSVVEGLFENSGRVIGSYAADANASPNYLAFALAPLLPLAAWLGTSRVNPPQPSFAKGGGSSPFAKGDRGGFTWLTIGVWLATTLIVLALYASLSRAGFVAGLGGLVIAATLAWSNVKGQMSKVLVIGLLVVSALSWFAVRPNFDLSPEQGGRITASNNVRWQLWSATGELVQQHWLLGTGLGGFQQRFDELTNDRVNYPEFITPRARTPHNLLVGMWMETGLLGLIGIIIILVLVGRTLFKALRQGSGQLMPAALIGSWFVLLAHGLVDQPIWKNDTMVLFWLLVAMSAVLTEDKQ